MNFATAILNTMRSAKHGIGCVDYYNENNCARKLFLDALCANYTLVILIWCYSSIVCGIITALQDFPLSVSIAGSPLPGA